MKAASTEHGEEKRDDDEVARRCSYPYSELKVRGYISESKEIIPSKLEVAPNALKMSEAVSGVEWSGYPLDCYDY